MQKKMQIILLRSDGHMQLQVVWALEVSPGPLLIINGKQPIASQQMPVPQSQHGGQVGLVGDRRWKTHMSECSRVGLELKCYRL